MCEEEPVVVFINGMRFIDVTGQTVAGPTYNYTEAEALSRGEHINADD